jgi:hypothetical protein
MNEVKFVYVQMKFNIQLNIIYIPKCFNLFQYYVLKIVIGKVHISMPYYYYYYYYYCNSSSSSTRSSSSSSSSDISISNSNSYSTTFFSYAKHIDGIIMLCVHMVTPSTFRMPCQYWRNFVHIILHCRATTLLIFILLQLVKPGLQTHKFTIKEWI